MGKHMVSTFLKGKPYTHNSSINYIMMATI